MTVAETIRGYLDANEITYESLSASSFSLTLPGEKKLQTPVRLDVGEHALGVHAFVCRNPDENHARVYRWLLERNLRMYAVAFAVDHAGDIYLDGRLPLSAVTPEEVDRLLGAVLYAHSITRLIQMITVPRPIPTPPSVPWKASTPSYTLIRPKTSAP